ncbi:hypothetical protein [Methylobacterium sp. ID0610]|uniref:hypothetical protein n=1 Tax=Methylobacterium carpenticola TaxID=3344827 RepID=UPI00369AEB8C
MKAKDPFSKLTRQIAFEIVALIGALLSFVCTLILSFQDKPITAGICASLFIITLIINQIPILDSIEAFSIKAKFNRKIQEVDDVLEKVRSLANTFAAQAYTQISAQGRLGTSEISEKSKIIGDINDLLRDLSVPVDQLKRNQEKLMRYMRIDFVLEIDSIVRRRISEVADEYYRMAQNQPAYTDEPESPDRLITLNDYVAKHERMKRTIYLKDEAVGSLTDDNFVRILTDSLPREHLSEEDIVKLESFIAESHAAYRKSLEICNYSQEASQILMTHGERQRKNIPTNYERYFPKIA